ncbi:MAG: molecular chaperone DnaJ [Candidatus Omnitrophica bacterium]|nr:molecular chaperone DnaJ [Candidatus Omnitrophota bacterium]
MSTQKDYYEILGVARGTSIDEIKKSYRKLAMQHHPDRVPEEKKKEAEEKFKEISEAYAVLSDAQKKDLYDKYGHAGIDSRYSTEDIFRGADFSSIFGEGGAFGGIFEDLFSGGGFDIFGGGQSQRRSGGRGKGEDAHLEISVSLENVSTGTEKEITFSRFDACVKCSGTGAEPGSSRKNCSTCGGRGVVSSGMGFINFQQTCPSCQGAGTVIEKVCGFCSGRGRTKSQKAITVKIPAGVATGSVLRMRQEGHYSPGGRGDLFLHINVNHHPLFERDGDTITCKADVSLIKSILGGEIEVPTLSGKVKMKIPQGTQPGTIFRLRGKGLMNLRNKRQGDELVEIQVKVPTKLSSKEKRLIEDWAKLRGEAV